MSRASVLLSLFLTGATGLIGEVVWARLLASNLGSTHRAMATAVLATLGGWALGSYLGGRLADRSRSPLRLFGLLALAVGAVSLAVPYLLEAADPLLSAVYRLNDGRPSHPLFAASEALAALAVLFLPGALLGAMLPVLARHLTVESEEAGVWIGSLVGLQSLGGALGAWIGGFILIPLLGLGRTATVVAGIEVALGLWVVLSARRTVAGRSSPEAPGGPAADRGPLAAEGLPPAEAAGKRLGRGRLLLAAVALWGMAVMMLEIGWTRAVLLALGNSTHAFSAILGIYSLGIFVGSIAVAPFADRVRSGQAAVGWAMAGAALLAAATIPALGVFPPEFAHWLSGSKLRMNYPLFLVLGLGWAAVLILPATILMGMVLPFAGRESVLAARAAAPESTAAVGVGRGVGALWAASTAGSLAGAALAGFVIYPLFGNLWSPLYLATALGLLAGVVLVCLDPVAPRRLPFRVAGVSVAVTVYVVFAVLYRPFGVFDTPELRQRYFSPITMSLGPLLNYHNLRQAGSVPELEQQYADTYETLYYRDGEAASVGVFRLKNTDLQTIRINGEAEASSGSGSMDLPVQFLSGHLPLLARPGARSALSVGVGSGISLGAMTLYPQLEHLTAVEISPEVLEAAGHFGEVNRRALSNPKVRSVSGDARVHLRHTAARYDVISSHPSNFWIAGQGGLYTREFYRLMADRLEPGGVACQCVIASRIRPAEFKTALRTFLEVFPHASLWSVGWRTLLLGSREPIEWNRDWIARCLSEPAILKELTSIGIDRPEALFRYLRFEDGAARRLAGPGPLNLDLSPRLEYSAPLGLFAGTNEVPLLLVAETLEPLAAKLEGFDSAARTAIEAHRRGGVLLQKLDAQLSTWQVNEGMEVILEIAKEEDAWLRASAGQLVGRYSLTRPENHGRLLLLRTVMVLDAPGVRQAYRSLEPGKVDVVLLTALVNSASRTDWTAHLLAAQEALDRDNSEVTIGLVEEARSRGAPQRRVEVLKGSALGLQGDLAAAEKCFEAALAAAGKGERGEIYYNLGFAREKRKDYLGAIEYQRLAKGEGFDPVLSGVALSRSLRAAGRAEEALAVAEEVSKKSENAEAFYQAAQALIDQGKHAEAVHWMVQAAAADPDRYQKELEALEARTK